MSKAVAVGGVRLSHVDVADVELLGGVAALEVASGVDVVVPHDAGDEVGGGDALRPLGGCEHAWWNRTHSNQIC